MALIYIMGSKVLMAHFASGCKHMITIHIKLMRPFVIMMLCGQISKQGWPM